MTLLGGGRSAALLLLPLFGALLECSPGRFDGLTGQSRAPRLVHPMSSTYVFTDAPTLSWVNPESVEDVVVDVCLDRDCGSIESSTNVHGSTGRVHFGGGIENIEGVDIEWPAPRFWRVSSMGAYGASSPTWLVIVAPKRKKDLSWGIASDINEDGTYETLIGEPESRLVAAATGVSRSVPEALVGEDRDACVDLILPTELVKRDELEGFGSAIALAGDVNGDGYPDLLVATVSSGHARSQVFLYSGDPSAAYLRQPPQEILVPGASPFFGSALAGAGDLDGDGYADIVIADDAGFFVLWGSPTGPGKPTVLHEASGERNVIGQGDFDGDGLSDFVVANHGETTDSVFVYYGARDRDLVRRRVEVPRPEGAQGFGYTLAFVSDVDLDGRPELFVAATKSSKGYLFTSGAGGKPELFKTFDGTGRTNFGVAVAPSFDNEVAFSTFWVASSGNATEKGTVSGWPGPGVGPLDEITEFYPEYKDLPGRFTGLISDLDTGAIAIATLDNGRGRLYREGCNPDRTWGRLETALDVPGALFLAQ